MLPKSVSHALVSGASDVIPPHTNSSSSPSAREQLLTITQGIRGKLRIHFSSEAGVGLGPTMEWFTVLCQELQRSVWGHWLDDGVSESSEDTVEMEVDEEEKSCSSDSSGGEDVVRITFPPPRPEDLQIVLPPPQPEPEEETVETAGSGQEAPVTGVESRSSRRNRPRRSQRRRRSRSAVPRTMDASSDSVEEQEPDSISARIKARRGAAANPRPSSSAPQEHPQTLRRSRRLRNQPPVDVQEISVPQPVRGRGRKRKRSSSIAEPGTGSSRQSRSGRRRRKQSRVRKRQRLSVRPSLEPLFAVDESGRSSALDRMMQLHRTMVEEIQRSPRPTPVPKGSSPTRLQDTVTRHLGLLRPSTAAAALDSRTSLPARIHPADPYFRFCVLRCGSCGLIEIPKCPEHNCLLSLQSEVDGAWFCGHPVPRTLPPREQLQALQTPKPNRWRYFGCTTSTIRLSPFCSHCRPFSSARSEGSGFEFADHQMDCSRGILSCQEWALTAQLARSLLQPLDSAASSFSPSSSSSSSSDPSTAASELNGPSSRSLAVVRCSACAAVEFRPHPNGSGGQFNYNMVRFVVGA